MTTILGSDVSPVQDESGAEFVFELTSPCLRLTGEMIRRRGEVKCVSIEFQQLDVFRRVGERRSGVESVCDEIGEERSGGRSERRASGQ